MIFTHSLILNSFKIHNSIIQNSLWINQLLQGKPHFPSNSKQAKLTLGVLAAIRQSNPFATAHTKVLPLLRKYSKPKKTKLPTCAHANTQVIRACATVHIRIYNAIMRQCDNATIIIVTLHHYRINALNSLIK